MHTDDSNDIFAENLRLKQRIAVLENKQQIMLDLAHKLRMSVTSVAAYAKLIENRKLEPEDLSDVLQRVSQHAVESVKLISSIQSTGYSDNDSPSPEAT